MKIGNRTHKLPACSAVPQPSALPCAQQPEGLMKKPKRVNVILNYIVIIFNIANGKLSSYQILYIILITEYTTGMPHLKKKSHTRALGIRIPKCRIRGAKIPGT
jgi:hypothetical protein